MDTQRSTPTEQATSEDEAPLSVERALRVLKHGDLSLAGYVPWSSNATLIGEVTDGEVAVKAVYKPRRGERPLWDFPAGTLCQREVAAFVVSQSLGWEFVPPTVLRDGPLGPGAVQLLIPHDPEVHYLSMADPDPLEVRRIAAFDVITNNADRKSGHVLLDPQGQLWIIDHGLTFHAEWKLRTVIWRHAGESLDPGSAADLSRLAEALSLPSSAVGCELQGLISQAEIRALASRTRDLLATGRLPAADPERRTVPWPPV